MPGAARIVGEGFVAGEPFDVCPRQMPLLLQLQDTLMLSIGATICSRSRACRDRQRAARLESRRPRKRTRAALREAQQNRIQAGRRPRIGAELVAVRASRLGAAHGHTDRQEAVCCFGKHESTVENDVYLSSCDRSTENARPAQTRVVLLALHKTAGREPNARVAHLCQVTANPGTPPSQTPCRAATISCPQTARAASCTRRRCRCCCRSSSTSSPAPPTSGPRQAGRSVPARR
jgi:hypothetical protein